MHEGDGIRQAFADVDHGLAGGVPVVEGEVRTELHFLRALHVQVLGFALGPRPAGESDHAVGFDEREHDAVEEEVPMFDRVPLLVLVHHQAGVDEGLQVEPLILELLGRAAHRRGELAVRPAHAQVLDGFEGEAPLLREVVEGRGELHQLLVVEGGGDLEDRLPLRLGVELGLLFGGGRVHVDPVPLGQVLDGVDWPAEVAKHLVKLDDVGAGVAAPAVDRVGVRVDAEVRLVPVVVAGQLAGDDVLVVLVLASEQILHPDTVFQRLNGLF
ncbi:hypothetical protein D3C86_1211810 [compost metagenome]